MLPLQLIANDVPGVAVIIKNVRTRGTIAQLTAGVIPTGTAKNRFVPAFLNEFADLPRRYRLHELAPQTHIAVLVPMKLLTASPDKLTGVEQSPATRPPFILGPPVLVAHANAQARLEPTNALSAMHPAVLKRAK